MCFQVLVGTIISFTAAKCNNAVFARAHPTGEKCGRCPSRKNSLIKIIILFPAGR